LSFLGGVVLNIVIGIGGLLLMGSSNDVNEAVPVLFALILEIILLVHFFRNNRYVAIGMLASLLLPLLLAGFCFMSFANH
jgi:Ca2+/Na+ antiporter